ncbi:MAG: hypothetical protein KF857_07765 [Fimbriimonadaceae bacterium]|nr:hypothetical protein [Fimbriimonadaceae bacterium]
MRKKQSPVMLIVLGAVILVGIGLTNSTDIWAKIFTPPPPQKDEKASDAQKVDTKSMVMKDVGKSKDKSKIDPENPPVVSGIPEEPSIFQPKFKRFEPSPNESSTTSQWYDSQSQEQVRKAELDKKRGY